MFFFKLFVFTLFLSLPEFLSLFRINLFYSFLKSLLTLVVNFNLSLQSQVNTVCEVQLVHTLTKSYCKFCIVRKSTTFLTTLFSIRLEI